MTNVNSSGRALLQWPGHPLVRGSGLHGGGSGDVQPRLRHGQGPGLGPAARAAWGPQGLEPGGGVRLGGLAVLLPQPAHPRHTEVPHERQGGVPHERGHVLRQSTSGGKTPLQGLPNQTCQGLVQMTVINNLILELHTYSSSLNKYFIQIVCCFCLIFGVDFYLASARKSDGRLINIMRRWSIKSQKKKIHYVCASGVDSSWVLIRKVFWPVLVWGRRMLDVREDVTGWPELRANIQTSSQGGKLQGSSHCCKCSPSCDSGNWRNEYIRTHSVFKAKQQHTAPTHFEFWETVSQYWCCP